MTPESWKEEYECCGIRKRIYWGEDGIQLFLRHTFFSNRKDMKRGISVAYNFRSFLHNFR